MWRTVHRSTRRNSKMPSTPEYIVTNPPKTNTISYEAAWPFPRYDHDSLPSNSWHVTAWASYQIRKIAGCAYTGNAGNVFPATPRISNPDMHHGRCVTHVPWCMPGSLTSGFLWSRWRGKRSRHSRRMCSPKFYVSGKRPMKQEFSAPITGVKI